MKLSLILFALMALIVSVVLALPTPERVEIAREIKLKRDPNDYVKKISRRKATKPHELTQKEIEQWEKYWSKTVGAGKIRK
ncbi:hypothetical protein RhiirA1_200053 [Rhizophagus irregularis]|uniref:Uncharacterized protein n=4 Tax=Rhizophagus irregularis TaxID=588596 RepID=A0A2N0RQD1_9GLOM|nr:hypothetical protein GLOIN_2v1707540 [Rhizophagus irregularis DAOM 181602=DAOM 197198]EXX75731.1 hypothetical protein RirG_039410 [Rhizophagus irregularis DAOM 197198w]PKC65520.1 hypothetical protein RhiirA1_200053 [Rhizophagus irregularis]POG61030.1 hypothetical protein GLOIN_2v1707540 [Rhizophagus irregularis DAOM 181602=DAOM 197198]UZO23360.1 hypothetical protein OCT59_015701 [Rhizophagus irregularis]CAB4390056.1 unnamed protein product [Rhizophagus irregularis]|eukprot:XP_025167896.1 hypothetical protein GLOIN_2v1707540 [Rhizophagus irregularis DAOM 181602=DAOM 197198]